MVLRSSVCRVSGWRSRTARASFAEHDPRDARIERREERRDVAELPAQRLVADLGVRDVVLGQPQQHAGEGRGS